MEETELNKKSIVGNYIAVSMLGLLFLSCYITQDIYEATTKYASLFTFALLVLLFFCQIDWKSRLKRKEKEIIVILVIGFIAAVNLVVMESHKGAILIVADLLLILYLCNKVSFSKKQIVFFTALGIPFLISWFSDVKWSYNFNMVGLVFLTFLILTMLFLEYMKEIMALPYLVSVQRVLYVTMLMYTIRYLSRCAMIGVLVFGFFILFGKKIVQIKWMYVFFVLLSTVGSLIFTLLYVLAGKSDINFVFLYKNLLSGREDIWGELWQAFLPHFFTGIGSSYEMKNFFIFEVHNGLLDILVVHGALVFLGILLLLIWRLLELRSNILDKPTGLLAMAGIFAMLFTSFFENYFIITPYLLVFFFLLVIINRRI